MPQSKETTHRLIQLTRQGRETRNVSVLSQRPSRHIQTKDQSYEQRTAALPRNLRVDCQTLARPLALTCFCRAVTRDPGGDDAAWQR
jgi:hypothetical protein